MQVVEGLTTGEGRHYVSDLNQTADTPPCSALATLRRWMFFELLVENAWNASLQGPCPVAVACLGCPSAATCLNLHRGFRLPGRTFCWVLSAAIKSCISYLLLIIKIITTAPTQLPA